jgi:hypothetical protein
MPIPADWLSEGQLADALAIPADERSAFHNNLRNWRRRRCQGLLPAPMTRNLGIGLGNEAVYPPVILPMLRHLFKLREDGRKPDEWFWQLWLAGYPPDVVGWTERALRRLVAGLAEASASYSNEEILHKATRKPLRRSDPRRRVYSRLYRDGWSRIPDATYRAWVSPQEARKAIRSARHRQPAAAPP